MTFPTYRTLAGLGPLAAATLFLMAAWFPRVAVGQEQNTGFSSPAVGEIVSEDGTVALEWGQEAPSGTQFEVRRWMQGEGGAGILVYEGRDTASFLSGLPEGAFELKVRSKSEGQEYPNWGGESLSVKVEYISQDLVLLLMSAGAVTFCCIVATIFMGHRAAERETAASR